MRRAGFTLLEVVIAMVILSIVAVVTLQMRLTGLRAGRAIAASQQVEHALDDVLELASHDMLPNPEALRNDEGKIVRITWRGDYLGVSYVCIAETILASAPSVAVADAEAPHVEMTVPVRRLTATIDGRTAMLYQPVEVRR